ncbi:MAG: baseplate J/gp47 family protein [Terriglobia bacterium]|nr:baseplate J/gp47 family protein [Terriglobia bacterium]
MALNQQSFTTLVQQQVAAIQAATTAIISFVVGSLELARVEAVAAVASWLQSLVISLLATTRLSTSTGNDVDTFVADFGLPPREAAIPSTGQVTFSRFTPTLQAIIQPGDMLLTSDGTQPFIVIADTTQPTWSVSANAYVIPAGTATATATVEAINAGTQGNVNANTITTISTAIVGVDTVTNALAYENGVNVESDTALQARFALYVQGLKQGIAASVASAIANLSLNIQYTLTEYFLYNGTPQGGYFYLVINPPTSGNIAAVTAAVGAVRPLGIMFNVFGSNPVTANIVVSVTAASTFNHTTVAAAVQTAIQSYIAGLGIGQTLSWTRLYSVIYGVSGVATATGLTINGSGADLSATAQQNIISGTVSVN